LDNSTATSSPKTTTGGDNLVYLVYIT